MDDVLIRRARAGEGPALSELALLSKAVHGYDAAFLDQCRAELTVDATTMAAGETWVAEGSAGLLLGFFDLRPGPRHSGEVLGLFISVPAVGTGLGRVLWSHLEARARDLGYVALQVDADPHVVPFYEAMGLKRTGLAPSGSIAGRFLPRLEKPLAPAQ